MEPEFGAAPNNEPVLGVDIIPNPELELAAVTPGIPLPRCAGCPKLGAALPPNIEGAVDSAEANGEVEAGAGDVPKAGKSDVGCGGADVVNPPAAPPNGVLAEPWERPAKPPVAELVNEEPKADAALLAGVASDV